ncbi:hypothetical protein C9994_15210 [Marivirga lumbricoides]|uniref:Lacal_2735 family protein n=1 Tax=Marivirga lumbricoides TaxID=1046115 RepID=A0A2T4DCT3_9BACT|nr:hypothetical protein C9994_15210 [Marivirga lumbricoides]
MFNIFKGKSERQKLNDQYKRAMEEYYQLSTVDRRKADEKMARADEISKQLDALDKKEGN